MVSVLRRDGHAASPIGGKAWGLVVCRQAAIGHGLLGKLLQQTRGRGCVQDEVWQCLRACVRVGVCAQCMRNGGEDEFWLQRLKITNDTTIIRGRGRRKAEDVGIKDKPKLQ